MVLVVWFLVVAFLLVCDACFGIVVVVMWVWVLGGLLVGCLQWFLFVYGFVIWVWRDLVGFDVVDCLILWCFSWWVGGFGWFEVGFG